MSLITSSYTTNTTYHIQLLYENKVKKISIESGNKEKIYRFKYVKNGTLCTIIGVPRISEKETFKNINYCFYNINEKELFFEVDCSTKFNSELHKFYLKDVREIICLSEEETTTNDNMQIITPSIIMYPFYLNGYATGNGKIVKAKVGDDLLLSLKPEITKVGDLLPEEEYSNFELILKGTTDIYVIENEKDIEIKLNENDLNVDLEAIVRYFIKELNDYAYYTIKINVTKKINLETVSDSIES